MPATPLTTFRDTKAYGRVSGVNVLPQSFAVPQGTASANMYQGGMALVVNGYAQEAVGSTAGTVVGRVAAGPGGQSVFPAPAVASLTNRAQFITIDQGCFMWDNPDPITNAGFGEKVYVYDDHSVTATAGSNACAGYFVGLDSATLSQAMVITILGGFGAKT